MKTAADDLPDDEHIAGTSTAVSEQAPFLGSFDSWEGGLGKRHHNAKNNTNNSGDDDDDDDDNDSGSSSRPGHSAGLVAEPQSLYRQNVVLLNFGIVFLLAMAYGISTPPLSAVMEAIICRQYHPDAVFTLGRRALMVTEDPLCKESDVQGYLASLRGWAGMVDSIPGLLLSLPFGVLSDRWGRKPVLGLSMVGMLLQFVFTPLVLALPDIFPIWAVLFSSVFTFIGGGWAVASAMFFSMLADVVPLADQSAVFFRIHAVILLADMISGPLAGALMADVGPRLPLIASIVMLFASTVLVAFLPETLGAHDRLRRLVKTGHHQQQHHHHHHHHRSKDGEVEEDEERGVVGTSGGEEMDDLTSSPASPRLKKKPSLPDVQSLLGPDTPPLDRGRVPSIKHTAGLGAAMFEVWEFARDNRRVLVLVLSLVFVVLGRSAQEILLQYTTKRYGWSWSRAALLLGIRSGATLVVLVVALPLLSWWCVSRRGMTAVRKDLVLARWSALVLVVGALVVAAAADGYVLAAGLLVLSAGGGLSSMIRTLTNALVEQRHIGTLNTLVGFMETVGMLVAGPALSQCLRVGLDMGGAWVGLPFLAAAAMFTASTVILWTVPLPREKVQGYSHVATGAGADARDGTGDEEGDGKGDEEDETAKLV